LANTGATPERALRVLLLTDRYPPHPGGLAGASRRLAGHAAASGHGVHVLVLRGEGPAGAVDSTHEGGLWVHRLAAGSDPVQAGQQAALAIDWLHGREGFDLFHGQYGSTAGFVAVYHARLLGAASYVSLRGNDLDRDLFAPERFGPLTWALQHAGAVGGVSRALVRQAEALTGRGDVRFTPNGVDGAVFAPAAPDPELRTRLGLGEGPIVGFAGELRHKKGAEPLLRAFAEAAPATGARLLLVGAVQRQLLATFAAEHPELAGRIRQHPYVHEPAELAALYALIDVVLCPSLWEGMPNAVLEAMACGRAVLASDAGGLPDLIASGETGWLVSRHRLHRLGAALGEVLALPGAERAAIGERARAFVLREYPVEREREELLAAYAAALSSSR
jgi:phosphatidylinositol alpha-1,6-mannosyltransferase